MRKRSTLALSYQRQKNNSDCTLVEMQELENTDYFIFIKLALKNQQQILMRVS